MTDRARPLELADRLRPAEHLTPELADDLRRRIGTYRDDLPSAALPALAVCDGCGREHRCYADAWDRRLCLGCVARLVASPPVLIPATTGVCPPDQE